MDNKTVDGAAIGLEGAGMPRVGFAEHRPDQPIIACGHRLPDILRARILAIASQARNGLAAGAKAIRTLRPSQSRYPR